MQDHITDKTIVIKPVDGEVTGETLETLKQKMKYVLVKCKKKKRKMWRSYTIIYLLKFLISHAFTCTTM